VKISMYKKMSLPAALLILSGLLFPVSDMAADPAKAGDPATGAKVWSENCGSCHNFRDARELRDDQWKTTVYHMRVRAGLAGQETRDVLAFLTASNKAPRKSIIGAVKVSATSATGKSDGQAIYNKSCNACHGSDGKGVLPGVPDFTSPNGPLSKNDDELFKNINEGFQSPGSPMAMPAKGGNASLTAEDVKAVLAYIRKFGK